MSPRLVVLLIVIVWLVTVIGLLDYLNCSVSKPC